MTDVHGSAIRVERDAKLEFTRGRQAVQCDVLGRLPSASNDQLRRECDEGNRVVFYLTESLSMRPPVGRSRCVGDGVFDLLLDVRPNTMPRLQAVGVREARCKT